MRATNRDPLPLKLMLTAALSFVQSPHLVRELINAGVSNEIVHRSEVVEALQYWIGCIDEKNPIEPQG